MQQWEYLRLGLVSMPGYGHVPTLYDSNHVSVLLPGWDNHRELSKGELDNLVNELGAEGWEMVNWVAQEGGRQHIAWFKRPFGTG